MPDGSLKTKSVTATGRMSVSRNSFPTVRDWIAEGIHLRRIEFDKYRTGRLVECLEIRSRTQSPGRYPSWRGPAYQTCKNAGRVAHRFPAGYRYRYMPFDFLEAVTAIAAAEPAAADALLAMADRQRWTLAQVRLEAARHRTNYHVSSGGDIATSIDDLDQGWPDVQCY